MLQYIVLPSLKINIYKYNVSITFQIKIIAIIKKKESKVSHFIELNNYYLFINFINLTIICL